MMKITELLTEATRVHDNYVFWEAMGDPALLSKPDFAAMEQSMLGVFNKDMPKEEQFRKLYCGEFISEDDFLIREDTSSCGVKSDDNWWKVTGRRPFSRED